MNKLRLRVIAAAGFVIALLIFSGCANKIVSNTIERRVEEKLPELVGPADSYKVKVRGGTVAMTRGRIQEMVVTAAGVRAMPELRIDDLRVIINDITADASTGTVRSVGAVRFVASVSERSINEYFAKTDRKDVRIELLRGKLVAHAKPRFIGIPAGVKVSGTLVPEGGRLDLRIDKLEVIGVNVPSIAENVVEKRINPVVDLSTTPFSPKLESVEMLPRVLRISGQAKMAGLVSSR
jgi:hypothetical protein